METWIHRLASLLPRRRPWEELAQSIALQAQTPVWQRVAPRILEMGRHEARGYVQARAALVIADRLEACGPFSAVRRNQLRQAALEQVVVWAVSEAGRQRRAAPRRRAA